MKKILTFVVFPIIIVVVGVLVWNSIQEPVIFKREKEKREQIGIQRLKDIRDLQVAYKSTYARFTGSLDTLIDFYKNGQITIVRQIGSMDDSVAVAMKLVRRDSIKINVRDTLLKRADFNPDDLRTIPYFTNDPDYKPVPIEMKAVVKKVSGLDVPLFEAAIPYAELLYGLDHQQIVNLYHERVDTGRYPGLKVGSIDAPNNNAGNWE